MATSKDLWQTVSIHPLITPLDTRSRPADTAAGAVRWKQNFSVSPEGKLCRRGGHEKFFSDTPLSSYTNYDYHHQGRTKRELPTFMFESTASDGTRRLFIGTQSSVSVLDPLTGLYTDIITGMGAEGSRWKCAELKDTLILTNDVDDIQAYQYIAPPTTSTPVYFSFIYDLKNVLNVHKAKLAVQYEGFVMLMNVDQDEERHANRIIWSDLNRPTSFDPAATNTDPDTGNITSSIAGFQDLDPGEIILAAAPLAGRLYIFTNRSIWWAQPSGDAATVFNFVHPYNEPKNQTGCLAYENTLTSTGTDLYYMGRDGIYRFNPYVPTPEREDWLHRASGLIYRKLDTQIDSTYCAAPVMEYVPDARELWISWPTKEANGVNNWTLAAQIEQKTADVVDTGYAALVNFRRNPLAGQGCNETQDFLGVSNVDWCIKSIGGVFLREYAELTDPTDVTVDLPETASYQSVGYNSILRGMIPTGLTDRDKRVRNVSIIDDTTAQDVPCRLNVRIGNHYQLVDSNDTESVCAPAWRTLPPKLLECTDKTPLTTLAAKNQRPAKGKNFKCWERGRYLFWEITITNQDGSPAIGADSCLMSIDFDLMAMPKPGN